MEDLAVQIIEGYKKAQLRKQNWEPHWAECYEYAFPQRENSVSSENYSDYGSKKNLHLYDATAADAVDQLASSLLAELTPPWAKWFGFKAGAELSDTEKAQVAQTLDDTSTVMLQNFEHSNFAVEIHQCYLDLVIAGTACLMFEEAPLGEASAFRFYAVPLREIAFEESAGGRIDTTYRCSETGLNELRLRFPNVELPASLVEKFEKDNKLVDLPDPELLLRKYNNPPGAVDINLNSLKKKRQINSIGVVSPQYDKMVYSTVFYYPSTKTASSELYLLNLDLNKNIQTRIEDAHVNRGKSTIYRTQMDSLDLDILGYIDHNITVNIIKDNKIVEKRELKLPKKLVNVIHCKNPRCITSTEQELPHIFYLADPEKEVYRCQYCDEKHS